MEESVEQGEVDRIDALECLFYLLFGNHLDSKSPFLGSMQQVGLSMPLLKENRGNQYKIERQVFEWNENQNKFVDPNRRYNFWEAGTTLAQHAGIANVLDALIASEETRNLVRSEAQGFWQHGLLVVNSPKGTPNFDHLIREYAGWLAEKFDSSGNNEKKPGGLENDAGDVPGPEPIANQANRQTKLMATGLNRTSGNSRLTRS